MISPPKEISEEFIQGMRNRMITSFYKYGPIANAYPNKVFAVESLLVRIDKYLDTGNTEWLMDAANFAMIEFMHPSHPEAHFRATSAEESPGRVTREHGSDSARNNSDLEFFKER